MKSLVKITFILVLCGYYGSKYYQTSTIIEKHREPMELFSPLIATFHSFEETDIDELQILDSYFKTQSEIATSFSGTTIGTVISDGEQAFTRFTRSKEAIEDALPVIETIRVSLDDVPEYSDLLRRSKGELTGALDDLLQVSRSQVRIIDAIEGGSYLTIMANTTSLMDAANRLKTLIPSTDFSEAEAINFFIDFAVDNTYLLEHTLDLLELTRDLQRLDDNSWFMGPKTIGLMGGLGAWIDSDQKFEPEIYGYVAGVNIVLAETIPREFIDVLLEVQIGRVSSKKLNVRDICDFSTRGDFPQLKRGNYVILGLEQLMEAHEGRYGHKNHTCADGYEIISAQPVKGFVYKEHIILLSRQEALKELPLIAKEVKGMLIRYEQEIFSKNG